MMEKLDEGSGYIDRLVKKPVPENSRGSARAKIVRIAASDKRFKRQVLQDVREELRSRAKSLAESEQE